MKSFFKLRESLTEAKATYCGRCGTTHVPPSQGGTCPALKKEEVELEEAKIGDKVTVTHGSQKGLVGHVGEIRKGMGGNHTYTVDYEEGGNRQSVQVKKAHTKLVKESSDDHELGIAHYDVESKAKHIEDVVKSHGGKMSGSSDKSVYVRFPHDKVESAKKALAGHGVRADHLVNGQYHESVDTVVKNQQGKVTSWKHEGDWKKATKKNPRGIVTHMADVAKRATEKMTKQ